MRMEVFLEMFSEFVLTLYTEFILALFPKHKFRRGSRAFLSALCVIVATTSVLLVIFGGMLAADYETATERRNGIIMLSVGCAVIALHIALFIETAVNTRKTKKQLRAQYAGVLGKCVCVTVDRPLGSRHPKHENIVYKVNYGYVADVIGGDGEEQDAYIIGVDEAVAEFDGIVTAVIHRFDDNECKWIVVPKGKMFSDEDIIEMTEFQEKYFSTMLVR